MPLDPGYPAERLSYMLKDSAPVALLTEARVRGSLPRMGVGKESVRIVDLADAVLWSDQPATNPERGQAGLALHHLAAPADRVTPYTPRASLQASPRGADDRAPELIELPALV